MNRDQLHPRAANPYPGELSISALTVAPPGWRGVVPLFDEKEIVEYLEIPVVIFAAARRWIKDVAGEGWDSEDVLPLFQVDGGIGPEDEMRTLLGPDETIEAWAKVAGIDPKIKLTSLRDEDEPRALSGTRIDGATHR